MSISPSIVGVVLVVVAVAVVIVLVVAISGRAVALSATMPDCTPSQYTDKQRQSSATPCIHGVHVCKMYSCTLDVRKSATAIQRSRCDISAAGYSAAADNRSQSFLFYGL